MGFLSLLGAAIPWRVIGIGAGALAICGAVVLMRTQAKNLGRMEAERDAAVASAASNAELLKIERGENARIRALADKANDLKAKLRNKSDEQRRNIMQAPPDEDGPLAPVLRRQLDELPEQGGHQVRSPAAAVDSVGFTRPQ